MKKKILLFFIFFPGLLLSVQGETNGYLSFEYKKGQGQADVSQGSFQNVLAGLIFSGEIAANVGYVSEIKFTEGNRIELEQALMVFNPSRSFNLQLGLYLVPFGKYNQSNRPHQTMLINFPLNVENIFPTSWRDTGIMLEGRIKSFFYSAYLGNGLSESENLRGGQQFRDNNTDKGKGGRVGLALSEGFEVACSYYRGKYDDGNNRNLVLQGVDLIWSSEDFQILSEYSKANLENPNDLPAGMAEGYFVQVSFGRGNLRPVGCIQWMKYKDDFHGPGFVGPDYVGEGISEEKSRWALGFVYLASQNFYLKFEYDFNREKDLEVKNNSFSVQAALSF